MSNISQPGPASAKANHEPRTRKKVFRSNDVAKVSDDLTNHGFRKGSYVVLLSRFDKHCWEAKPYGEPKSEVRSITEFELE